MKWMEELDDEQRTAAMHDKGHALVSAAPGSGKTRMLVAYIARLVETRIAKGSEILGIAFGQGAAKELDARIRKLELKNGRGLKFQTFHSFCKEVLEAATEESLIVAGDLIPEEHTIRRMMKNALAQPGQSLHDVDEIRLDLLADTVNLAKSRLMPLGEDADLEKLTEMADGDVEVARAAVAYEAFRLEQGIRAYADLIYDLAMAIKNRPDVAKWVANGFTHIAIDEYQDIDDAQHLIIKAVAGTRAQIFAVGDEDQCIYGWRGANLHYMLHGFEEDYGKENVTRYQLSKTYRYGHELAVISNSLIRNNVDRPDKTCVSANTTGRTEVVMLMASDPSRDRHWYKAVISDLADWKRQGRKLAEAAVLTRSYDVVAPLELALIRHKIPYVLDGRGALDMPEVKSLMGYAMLTSPDEFSALGYEGRQEVWKSVLAYPYLYVSNSIVSRIADALAGADLNQAIQALRDLAETQGLKAHQVRSFSKRADLLEKLVGMSGAGMPVVMKEVWQGLDWKGDVRRRIQDPVKQSDRIDAINLMCAEISRYDSPTHLMDAVEDRAVMLEEIQYHDTLRVTSIHKAKGCEWPLVFVPGLAEGKLPHFKAESNEDMEAERRLFFVAMTRAMERLVIIAPNDEGLARSWRVPMEGAIYRKSEESAQVTSRFLDELDVPSMRAAKTWFYGVEKNPVTPELIAYSQKAGRPLEGAYIQPNGTLTNQPLADTAPAVSLDDYHFNYA